jgi:hypothetical protein
MNVAVVFLCVLARVRLGAGLIAGCFIPLILPDFFKTQLVFFTLIGLFF